MIIFADHDIVKQPPYGKIDLISCRNLLIYINPLLQKKILTSLHFCLNMGGFLFLGPSENLGELRKSFSEIDKKWKIFRNIEINRNFRDTTYTTPGFEKQWTNPAIGVLHKKHVLKNNLTEIINKTLLEESGYEAGICVDEDFKITLSFGNYEKYLLPKIFNFKLLEMLPAELSMATSNTLRMAKNQNNKAIIKGVKFEKNGSINSVNLFIKPFSSDNATEQTVFLVLFGDENIQTISKKEVEVFNFDEHTHRNIEDLKNELEESRIKLRYAYEALDLSNENISSYNEELISSNEEMQSTNEELQSVNEELQTVNSEYQLKIKELAELNDDLNNYFRGTVNGQIYVDNNHIVRKFTPFAIQQVNLKESDIGRPLSDISTNIKFATLIEDINNVTKDSVAKEKEIQTNDGRWYQMMIIPYIKQQDNQIDGVIITFNDITKLKITQEKLYNSNEDHDTFIYSASHDLKGPIANIEGLIGLLEEIIQPEDKEALELTGMIDKSVLRLKETVAELSNIVRIESEFNEQENIHVNDLLEEIKLSMKGFLLRSKAKIHIDLKEQEITFAKKNLRSILANLLSNAVKYASPDREPEVKIRTEKTGDYIVLTVQDNGLGLKENKLKDLFTKFQRLHSHVEGTGIGLYLTKKLITNAGGKIEVESELGKGSTFRVYFLK